MLNHFFRVVKAEAVKQHKNYFHSQLIYFSMLAWPILTFTAAYFTYKPFRLNAAVGRISYLTEENLITFILIGYLAQMFFRSLVQSAWWFSFERTSGTLELIYLSPANRLACVFGNAVSSLFESVWLFVIFSGGILLFYGNVQYPGMGMILLAVLTVMIPSVLWGMLLNAMFLFSRDTRILFTILEEPMELFAGVKVPVAIFPVWAKAISFFFPLTYSIEVLRRIFLKGEIFSDLASLISTIVIVSAVMLMATVLLLKIGEGYAKKTGNMSLF
ncbi:MAG: ABC transporter permease [Bacillota bacterium]